MGTISHPHAAALARCEAEISEILNRPDVVGNQAPAWLVTLGIEDWRAEADLISRGIEDRFNGTR
jgi:hypothetical protein